MRKLLLLLAQLLMSSMALAACSATTDILIPKTVSVLDSSDYLGGAVKVYLDKGSSYPGGALKLSIDDTSEVSEYVCECSDNSLCVTPGYGYNCTVTDYANDLSTGRHTFTAYWSSGLSSCSEEVEVKHVSGFGVKDTVAEKFVDYNLLTDTQQVVVKVVNSSQGIQKYDLVDDFDKRVLSNIITSSPCQVSECLQNSSFGYYEPAILSDNLIITKNDPTYSVSFQVAGNSVKTVSYEVRNASGPSALAPAIQLAGCGYEVRIAAPIEGERFPESQETGVVRFQVFKDDDAVFAPNVDVSIRNASTGEEVDVQVSYRADTETYEGAFIFGAPGTYELRVAMTHTVCGDFQELRTFYKGGPTDGSTTAATGFDSSSLFVVLLLVGVLFVVKALIARKN